MKLLKRRKMEQFSNAVEADNSPSERARQLCQFVRNVKNEASALLAGDQPVLELLKPQTTVTLAETEVDAAAEKVAKKIFVSRYKRAMAMWKNQRFNLT